MIFFSVLLFAAFQIATADIPQVNCNVRERQFKKCLETSIVNILPQLIQEGVPELNILPIDPLDIPALDVKMDSKIVHGSIYVTNTRLLGLNGLENRKFRMEMISKHNYDANLEAYIPDLLVEGDFKANLLFNKLKIDGVGHYELKLKKLRVTVLVKEKLIIKDEGDYFDVYKVSVQPQISGFKLNATMDKNPKLAEMGVNMINSFWPLAFKQIYPFFKPKIEQIVLDHLKEYFDQVPIYSQFISES